MHWFFRARAQPRIFLQLSLCCALFASLAACGGSNGDTQPTPTNTVSNSLITRINSFFRSEADSGTFSGALLMTQNGKTLLRKGYGMADYEHQSPNQPTTKFRIADLTMQFTALATLMLQEQGKLHVQDTICTYLTGCPTSWQAITIQQLLTLSSGIPDYNSYYNDRDKPETPQQLVARLQSKTIDSNMRGFSTSDYLVLGAIIEKVSGEGYADFIQHTILDPLGLKHTGYEQNNPPVPEYALGYEQARVPASPVDASVPYSADGLYSTVDDIYKWDQALLNHKIASKATTDSLFAVQEHLCSAKQRCRSYSALDLGYSWLVGKTSDTNAISVDFWNGNYVGFSSGSYYYPDAKLSVIILSNLDSGEDTIASTLQSMLFGE